MAMDSNIVEFPTADRPITEGDIDELHAEAFRDIKHHISDCVTMSRIAAELMDKAKGARKDLSFAVFHLHEMLLNLEKYYGDAWEGGNALAYRLITSPAKTTQEIKESCASLPTEEQP
jgi:hypothetical protein